MRSTARTGWAMRAVVPALALVTLVAPRLITAAPLDMLASARDGSAMDPAEDGGQNFPGSAFFFAQGAFDPAPGADVVRGRHVLGLATVTAAPAAMFRGMTPLDHYRALNCLTAAVYYEAGNEPEEGQRAVAQVVLNRTRNVLWPASVCGVVYQGSERADVRCQFTFSCDGSMARMPAAAAWARSRRIAADALMGSVYAPVGLATHYHTLAVRPAWAGKLQPVAVIGAHIFYRIPGVNGTMAAFRRLYLGRETIAGPTRTAWPDRSAPTTGVAMDGDMVPMAIPAPPMNGPAAHSMPASIVESGSSVNDGLPESTIRPEYRNSGRPLI